MITHKQFPNHKVYEMEIGGRPFTVETGKVAELADAEKDAISHRGRALEQLEAALPDFLPEESSITK